MKATVKKVQSIETEIDIAAFSFQLKSLQYMEVKLTNGKWVRLGGANSDTKVTYDHGEFKFDNELKMVNNVRRAEQMLGSGIKEPNNEENLGRKLHRRSLISVKIIPKGKIIEEGDISVMRGTLEHIGASPELYNDILGLRANREINKNEPIKIGMFSNNN